MTNIPIDEVFGVQVNRATLSGEVEDLLLSIDYFNPRRLAIISSHVLKYLTNQAIKDTISRLDKTEVNIYYPTTKQSFIKKKVEEEIKYLKNQISSNVNDRIKFVEVDDCCDRTLIICDPGFVIAIIYDYVVSSEGDMFLKETATVHFSPAEVSQLSGLIEEYEQQHTIIESNS